jgi:hypothetical protein
MDIVESIERYLAGSPVTKGERTRLVRARDEIMRLRKSAAPCKQWEWIGLTDDEIYKLSDDCVGVRDGLEFIRAIESKLREKNT